MTTTSLVERIEAYVSANARPLDVARFQHALKGADVEPVVEELSKFQNSDGGFGHGLEADLRLPESSPICTWVGLEILIELGIAIETGIVQRALNYLQATFNVEAGRWMPVEAIVNDHPHAGWFHFEQEKGGTPIHQNPWNPTAALTGFLWHYDASAPTTPAELTEGAITYLRELAETDMEMHELAVMIRLASLAPQPYSSDLQRLTLAAVQRIVETDPVEWSGYGPQPLNFVSGPEHFLYPALSEHVGANLDYWIESLKGDGSWELPYQWYRDDEVFARLKPELTAAFALQRAIKLRAFDRL